MFHLVQHDPRAENVDEPNSGNACVELAQPRLLPEVGTITCAPLGVPYFAEPVRLERDRCTDDGSTVSDLRAACIGDKGALVHVHARRDGEMLLVSTDDGTPPVRWGPNRCIATGAYRFVIPETVPRFDAIRASWGRRGPSDRCAASHGPPTPVEIFLRESMPPTIHGIANQKCGENGSDETLVALSIPSLRLRRDLGPFGNGCGSYFVSDLVDVGGVELGHSNMGSSRRFLFPMGDRLVFLTAQNATETIDLPCGAKPHFRVFARGERVKVQFLR